MLEKPTGQPIRLTETQIESAMNNLPDPNMLGKFELREFLIEQERPRRQLIEIITKSPPGTVAIISEPLGSGKSSLISMVIDDLISSGYATYEECLRAPFPDADMDFDEFYWSGTYSYEKPVNSQKIKPKVVFIEEFDRKSNFLTLHQAMQRSREFLGKNVPIMVLSGDYTLKNPALVQSINSPYEPVYISLDPSTPQILKRTLELRLRYALGEEAQEVDMDALFEPDFFNYLLPNTTPPIATMRESLVILQILGRSFKKRGQPAIFSWKSFVDVATELHDRNHEPFWKASSKNWHFVNWLHEYIRNSYNPTIPMEAMTISDFKRLCPLTEISDKEYPEFIRKLAEESTLQSVGVPYLHDPKNPFPEPYLPSQSTFIDAAFRPLPPKTPEEVRKEQEIAAEKAKLARLRSLYKEGVIGESTFLQKRNQLLGLDTLLDSFIRGDINRETFVRRKDLLEFDILE